MTRNHPRPLRYTQAPAIAIPQQHWAQPIEPPANRPSRFWHHTLASIAIGAIVVSMLIGCGPDDITTEQLTAEDIKDAQADALRMHREAQALAALTGIKH